MTMTVTGPVDVLYSSSLCHARGSILNHKRTFFETQQHWPFGFCGSYS